MELSVDDLKAFWIVPGTVNSRDLETNVRLLRQYIDEPPFFEGGQSAADLLRRKAVRNQSYGDSDCSSLSASSDSDSSANARKPNKKRKRRAIDDAELETRRENRRLKDLEKRALIKSAARIEDSDNDEDADREFFERERQLRVRMARKAEDLQANSAIKFGAKRKRPLEEEEVMELDSDHENIDGESFISVARDTTPSVSMDAQRNDRGDSEDDGSVRLSKISRLRRTINIDSDEE